jgi:hypothetical protein
MPKKMSVSKSSKKLSGEMDKEILKHKENKKNIKEKIFENQNEKKKKKKKY